MVASINGEGVEMNNTINHIRRISAKLTMLDLNQNYTFFA
jgi:hypothetical protein